MGVARRTTTAEAPSADDYTPDTSADTAETNTEEPENDTPARSSNLTRRGWGAAKSNFKKTAANYEAEFKVSETEDLVKYLEDEPFTTILVHWVDEIREGKRSFYCLSETDDEGCPLCAVGHKPKAEAWFNVVPLTDEGAAAKPEVKVLKTGPMLGGILESDNNDRFGPLSRHFWALSKTGGGKKGRVTYSTKPVKARDLAEDWELDPAAIETAVAALKPYDESVVRYPSREDLEEIVQTYLLDD